MNKLTFIMAHPKARALAQKAIEEAPEGWICTIHAPKRTDRQNELIQPLIREWAQLIGYVWMDGEEVELTADDWRHILVAAFRKEIMRTVSFDGSRFALGSSSKDLSVKECSEFVEFIHAAAAERGFRLTSLEPEPTGR